MEKRVFSDTFFTNYQHTSIDINDAYLVNIGAKTDNAGINIDQIYNSPNIPYIESSIDTITDSLISNRVNTNRVNTNTLEIEKKQYIRELVCSYIIVKQAIYRFLHPTNNATATATYEAFVAELIQLYAKSEVDNINYTKHLGQLYKMCVAKLDDKSKSNTFIYAYTVKRPVNYCTPTNYDNYNTNNSLLRKVFDSYIDSYMKTQWEQARTCYESVVDAADVSVKTLTTQLKPTIDAIYSSEFEFERSEIVEFIKKNLRYYIGSRIGEPNTEYFNGTVYDGFADAEPETGTITSTCKSVYGILQELCKNYAACSEQYDILIKGLVMDKLCEFAVSAIDTIEQELIEKELKPNEQAEGSGGGRVKRVKPATNKKGAKPAKPKNATTAKKTWERTDRKVTVKGGRGKPCSKKTVYRCSKTGELRVRKMVARPDGTKRATYVKF